MSSLLVLGATPNAHAEGVVTEFDRNADQWLSVNPDAEARAFDEAISDGVSFDGSSIEGFCQSGCFSDSGTQGLAVNGPSRS